MVDASPPGPEARARRQLLVAGVLTLAALALVVAAVAGPWWHGDDRTGAEDEEARAPARAVHLVDRMGNSRCGTPAAGPEGTVRLDTADGPFQVAVEHLVLVAPVAAC